MLKTSIKENGKVQKKGHSRVALQTKTEIAVAGLCMGGEKWENGDTKTVHY